MKKYLTLILIFFVNICIAQIENINDNKFKQLGSELPTPNSYRTASGAPGHEYWQQQADVKMDIELDDENQKITGTETITYHNNSPDALKYLWLQLDQNMRAKDSDTYKIRSNSIEKEMSPRSLSRMNNNFDGGFKIESVTDAENQKLNYTIVKTMMRVDLPNELKTGEKVQFNISWWYNINNRMEIGGRSGYEYFEEDDNYLYTIAQFFPRMCVYDEIEGWQHKQFLGRGEFALVFGDYEVNITVPEDHMVSSTGILINPKDVLTDQQMQRLNKAEKERDEPVFIVTEDEAIKNESSKSKRKKTWTFKAENVRDFAFASSRKFIWDAVGVPMSDGRVVMAMSMYPKEGNPLWEMYSTKSIVHTLKWYSHYTFDYPYPVAWSIHTDRIGMEYPMICFNGGRPESDGTYSKRTKYGLISVIIHEVGHNYFPMIVNSDERQWTWMDEGLNSYVQFLAEQQWERDYPSRRGPAWKIADYMKGDKSKITPIMTNSESIFQFGNNAYGKPATALNILRETIVGRELFDFAFKEYCRRWMFKHPAPADLFRTLEDASGVDLDWFWRGWFYTTDHVDIAINNVSSFQLTNDPEKESQLSITARNNAPNNISSIRNKKEISITQDEIDKKLVDFYSTYDPLKATEKQKEKYKSYINSISDKEKSILNANQYYHEIEFENIGGLVMPVIVQLNFKDGSNQVEYIPAEIWRMKDEIVTKVFITSKEIESVSLDPFLETADTNLGNNHFPPKPEISRFKMFQNRNNKRSNPMQESQQSKKGRSGSN